MTAAHEASFLKRRTAPGIVRLLGRFARRSDGTVAVELALVALPFLWLLFIILETAGVIFADIALQNGVSETARLIRTGQVQIQGIGSSKFKELLCNNIALHIDCSKLRVDITRSAKLPISGTDMMTVKDGTTQSWQPGGPMEWVLVQARYDWQLTVPGIRGLANMGANSKVRRLVAGAMFRNEPYSN